MERIVVSDNMSLDGVIQDPAGDEGFRLGGWVRRSPFRRTNDKKRTRLVDMQIVDADVASLIYQRVREATAIAVAPSRSLSRVSGV